jgi:hypothetical protein
MAPSPALAVQTVKEFGGLRPFHEFGKPQKLLLKKAGIGNGSVKLHDYIACMFWAGFDEAHRHIDSITFNRLPQHPDISERLEAQIEGGNGWGSLFSDAPRAFDQIAYVKQNNMEPAFMRESVTIGKEFIGGLFTMSRLLSS